MEIKKFQTEVDNKKLEIEIGKLAQQANGSVTVKYGDTIVLVTCVMGDEPREGVNYLPLMVNYEEKLYAAGKIKGSRFIKREGRPTDKSILASRLIDRILRPLFDQKIRNDLQVVTTVLSFDEKCDPVIPALIGASLALSISNIPWDGPVGGVIVGKDNNNQWQINPPLLSEKQIEEAKKEGESVVTPSFNLVVAGTKEKINMLEGEAKEASEEDALKAIKIAQEEIKKIIEFEEKIIKEIQPQKRELNLHEPEEKLTKEVNDFIKDKLEKALYQSNKKGETNELGNLKKDLKEFIKEKYDDEEKVKKAFDLLEEKIDNLIHKNILEKDQRPDGRKLDEIRNISCEIGLLPRAHGSGLFTRGKTQALSVITLGPPGDEQLLDEMEAKENKRFMLHYNFPPYSVGETSPMRGPGRREIGHGALAEKALSCLLPEKKDFSYTIRVVSEIFSSNGSSSMASVCGSTLALLDAGVKIKESAAGIAMGLVLGDNNKYKILTDIQGPEDHYGDMDLKIAGTKNGITAIQMDVKVKGLGLEILKDGFAQAKKARLEILKIMEKTIKSPNSELSDYAPRVFRIKIDPKQIGRVIGPGGKMINKIIDETGADIDIEDSGSVFISGKEPEGTKKAISWIKDLTRELKRGEIFQGKVVKIADFGAFIELVPGQEGLLHISELSPKGERVKKVEDVLQVGGIITVRIKNIDEQKKISLELFKKGVKM